MATSVLERYSIGSKIGEGAFGTVFSAVEKTTGTVRAIKRMKGTFTWDAAMDMRDLKAILRVPPSPNIVQLLEVHRSADNVVDFVFEFMSSGSLHDLIEHRIQNQQGPLTDGDNRCLLRQMLAGVQHLHGHHIIHRDLKPENILIAGRICKLADFSLARFTDEQGAITTYVSTRWYRAPEILLSSAKYSEAVDIFALGCIAAEMYASKPLFRGKDEIHQLRLIFAAFGTPETVKWDEGIALLKEKCIKWCIHHFDGCQEPARAHLEIFFHLCDPSIRVTDSVMDFLLGLLQIDPLKRTLVEQAIKHTFFTGTEATSLQATFVPGGPEFFGEDNALAVSDASTPVQTQKNSIQNAKSVTVSPATGSSYLASHQRKEGILPSPDSRLLVSKSNPNTPGKQKKFNPYTSKAAKRRKG